MNGNLSFGPSSNIDTIQSYIANRPGSYILDDYRTAETKNLNYYGANEKEASGYLMNFRPTRA